MEEEMGRRVTKQIMYENFITKLIAVHTKYLKKKSQRSLFKNMQI